MSAYGSAVDSRVTCPASSYYFQKSQVSHRFCAVSARTFKTPLCLDTFIGPLISTVNRVLWISG